MHAYGTTFLASGQLELIKLYLLEFAVCGRQCSHRETAESPGILPEQNIENDDFKTF